MKKIIILVILLLLASAFLILKTRYFQADHTDAGVQNKKLTVVASFYPLEYFAKAVGGDAVVVQRLTPSGGEPHDYEPTAQDMIKIQKANVLLLNGAGVENWTKKVIPQLPKSVEVLQMSDKITLLPFVATDAEDGGSFDPHIWLDPVLAAQEVSLISETLIRLDPVHAQVYQQNTKLVLEHLHLLDQDFAAGLKNCQKDEAITSHNAFQYLAHRYGFTFVPVSGFSPSQDPSPQHLAELVKVVQQKHLGYIFTETLSSPKFANTLATEAGIQTLVLNPIEGLTAQDQSLQKNYETIMRENLKNLRIALECR